MIHKMNLAAAPFAAIAAGKKTIEMRLYDERRVGICVDDEIEFEKNDTGETLKCKVVSLTRFRDFFELYSNFDKVALGYNEKETARPEDMYQYYAPERVAQYGVLAIEIKLI